MLAAFPEKLFVTGTDTSVGKTIVSAILTLGLNASYWKPIQSGFTYSQSGTIETDSTFLQSCGVSAEQIIPERFLLSKALSPHLSAKLDEITISLTDFKLPESNVKNHLIIEGAGGLLVPINDKDKIIDLIAYFEVSALLVARTALGTINHTLLSLEALRSRNIPIAGVVMCGEPNRENRLALEHFGKVPVLAEIPILPDFRRETLLHYFDKQFLERIETNVSEKAEDLASLHANAYSRSSS